MTLIPRLIPLVTDDSNLIKPVIELVLSHGRQKEIVLALNEVLVDIEDRGRKVNLSEDGFTEDGEVDPEGLARQLNLVIKSYSAGKCIVSNCIWLMMISYIPIERDEINAYSLIPL